MAYTWTELLDSIKTRGMIPTSQNTYTPARFLVMANEELRSGILPLLLKARENYYSYDDDQSVNETGIYNISTRAIGAKLQNLALIEGTSRFDLGWLTEEEMSDTSDSPTGEPGAFIKGNQVHLKPATGHGFSTLRMTIYLRPAEIVATTSAAQVTAINSGTRVVTFSSVPSTWTTSNTFDFVQANPHFDSLAIDQAASSVTTGSSGTITFSSALPSRLAVGDWVGLAGQSPIPQLPLELHPLLAQMVANQCLKNSPHTEAFKIGEKEVERMKKELLGLVTPRIDKEGKKIVNRTGMLRRGR